MPGYRVFCGVPGSLPPKKCTLVQEFTKIVVWFAGIEFVTSVFIAVFMYCPNWLPKKNREKAFLKMQKDTIMITGIDVI